jgi:hypothetical protein
MQSWVNDGHRVSLAEPGADGVQLVEPSPGITRRQAYQVCGQPCTSNSGGPTSG